MKLTVLRNELVSALSAVMGVIERSQTLQVLSHVLIDATGDVVAVTGTNLEIELRTTAAATVDAPGKTTVHARKLFDIAKNLPEGAEVQLAFDGDKATLKCGRSRYTLPVMSAIDMPLMDCRSLDQGATFQVAERDLKRLIQRVAFAVGAEDVRPYLNGLLLHLIDNEIRAVGSDGVSLGRASIRQERAAAGQAQVLLHNRTIRTPGHHPRRPPDGRTAAGELPHHHQGARLRLRALRARHGLRDEVGDEGRS
jgi:DNA polymerase III subunit beta